MGVDAITDKRLDRVEEIHAPGGPCDEHRETFWKELARLKGAVSEIQRRLDVINIKLWGMGILLSFFGSVLGTVAVQLILKWIR